ncbi:MAG: glycosyltransferase family 1 protein [Candidatus Omnitrophica bacterium]|nr:glycosyltransferase family 1 protein [Candidatus Omnitrophota bacterium]
MKIAILNITAGGMSDGYRKYLLNVIPRLARHKKVEALFVGIPETIDFSIRQNNLHNISWVKIKPSVSFKYNLTVDLRKELSEFAPDVIFIPTARAIVSQNVPVVNMVQNMLPLLRYKGDIPLVEAVRLKIDRLLIKKAVFLSTYIIAPSLFVKNSLIKEWAVLENKIAVVYFGSEMENKNCRRPALLPTEITKGNFLFMAGPIEPYKGLEDIIIALKNIKVLKKDVPYSVIAGAHRKSMDGYAGKLKKMIGKNGLDDRIIWAGQLNEEEMNWCYANCSLFLVASRVESMSFISLEAMSHGCLIIAANNPPLPEIHEDSAVYYQPYSGKDLSDKIIEVLSWDLQKRSAISERALKRASEFSWDKTIDQIIRQFEIAEEIKA